jgi:hypothetical protein
MPGIDNVSVHLGRVRQRTVGRAEARQQLVSAGMTSDAPAATISIFRPLLLTDAFTVTCRLVQPSYREKSMEDLISRAIYHPLVALPTFYLTDLMCNVDYSLFGALLVLAAGSTSRLVRLSSRWYRRNRRESGN